MTAVEIAAYIGAAAWLPQLLQWLYTWLRQPKLKLLSGETIGACYNHFGPVVTLTTAISCDRRDALIRKVILKITHEKGEKRQLTWVWLSETQMQISIPTGETLDFAKNQPALALKVGPQMLAEKKITFSDREFQTRYAEITEMLLRQYDYLKKTVNDAEDSLIKTREFMDAQDFFNKNFYWKEGRYDFDVELEIVGRSSRHKERFVVVFTTPDVGALQENTPLYESQVRAMLKLRDGQQAAWPQWKWVNPTVNPFS
jgi:hypothetical protein